MLTYLQETREDKDLGFDLPIGVALAILLAYLNQKQDDGNSRLNKACDDDKYITLNI